MYGKGSVFGSPSNYGPLVNNMHQKATYIYCVIEIFKTLFNTFYEPNSEKSFYILNQYYSNITKFSKISQAPTISRLRISKIQTPIEAEYLTPFIFFTTTSSLLPMLGILSMIPNKEQHPSLSFLPS